MSNWKLLFHSVLNGVATAVILSSVVLDQSEWGWVTDPWYWIVLVSIVVLISNSIIMGRN